MGYHNRNLVDDTTWEFPRGGFWALHVISAAVIFFIGMRYAMHRAPMPLIMLRLLRMLGK